MLAYRGNAHYNYYHNYVDKAAMFDFLEKLGLTTPNPQLATGFFGSIFDGMLGYIAHGTRDHVPANVADVYNSIVNMAGFGTTIIMIMLTSGLSARFGRKNVALVCFSLAALNAFAMYLVPPTGVWALLALAVTGSFVYAPTCAIMWAMYADAADYSEWQTGRRFTGMVFATIGFSLKSGLAVGGAAFLWLMAWLWDYDTAVQNAPHAIRGYQVSSSIFVGLFFVACVVSVAFCSLTKDTTLKMAAELAERRKKAGIPA
jgi:Na+/melibiose symporter-like transporter